MTPQQKQMIDDMSYEHMLRLWRFSPVGDPTFQGETGEYFAKVMREKANQCDTVVASKLVGWGD
jgi:hypothetical protein